MALATQRRTHIEDPGGVILDRMTGYWNRFGRFTLAAAGVIAAAALLGFYMLRVRAAQENEASGQLTEASYFFWQGDYARSLQVAKQLTEQFPSTWSGTDALRIAADDCFWTGDYKSSVDYYKRYLDKVKGGGVVGDAARRSYAYALESDRQYKAAADQFESLVGKFDRESSAEFLAASARCYRTLGQQEEGAKRLRRVLDEFGETSQALNARVRLGELGQTAP